MALQNGVVSVTIRDAYGITSSAPIFVEIDDSKTIAQLLTDVATYRAEIGSVTQGVVDSATVTINEGTSSTIEGVGDIEKGGLFNFSNSTDNYATPLWVPDIDPAVLNGAGLIDLSNTNVASLITFLTTAHTVITAVSKGVRALTALKDALISFRKHRKPLARKTKEF